ncbi:hypothetical protein MMC07_006816 [Pseudocyphellaria aurata]|nr:hypothetical protein [Pseudocyphellaria aurata]
MGLPQRVLLAVTSATPQVHTGAHASDSVPFCTWGIPAISTLVEHTTPIRVVRPMVTLRLMYVDHADGRKSGLYWSETLHPFNVFIGAGYELDVVAERPGHFGYDEHSISEDTMDAEPKEAWADPSSALRHKLKTSLLNAAKVDANKVQAAQTCFSELSGGACFGYSDVSNYADQQPILLVGILRPAFMGLSSDAWCAMQYGIFFAAGGLGAVYDFPEASNLHALASQVYANGGVVSAVCHGPAVLPGVRDSSTGKPLIQGKRVTGFTKKGKLEASGFAFARLPPASEHNHDVTCLHARDERPSHLKLTHKTRSVVVLCMEIEMWGHCSMLVINTHLHLPSSSGKQLPSHCNT